MYRIRSLIVFLIIISLVFSFNINVFAADDGEDGGIYVDGNATGKFLHVSIDVTGSSTSLKYRTLGFKMTISNSSVGTVSCIFPISFAGTTYINDFYFHEIAGKVVEQSSGKTSLAYKKAYKILFETGGSIDFAGVMTMYHPSSNTYDGSLVGHSNAAYTYSGYVYDTYLGIVNAPLSKYGYSWSEQAKIDLTQYFQSNSFIVQTNPDPDPVVVADPVPQFKITYNGTDVTDKDFKVTTFPATVTLTDTSTTPSGASIALRSWQLFNNNTLAYAPIASNVTSTTYTITETQVAGSSSASFMLELNGNSNLYTYHYCRPYKDAPPITPPTQPTSTNKPPVADIRAPYRVTQGDTVHVDASSSWDSDGYITGYTYSLPEHDGNISGDSGDIQITTSGTFSLGVTVTDNGDLTDDASTTIIVDPPIPWAIITYTGLKLENHKITLSALKSITPAKYPLDESKTVWEITPVSGGAAEDIKYRSTLSGTNLKDVMFKKQGTYKVKLLITNTAGYSNSTETTLDIGPNLDPVADMSVSKTSVRDQVDSYGLHYGIVKVYDLSSCPDGDTIGRIRVTYRYDSDNDGSFNDEAQVTLYDSDSNPENADVYYTDRPIVLLWSSINRCACLAYPGVLTGPDDTVGKTIFDIEVWEKLDETNSFPEFLLNDDIKRDDSFDW